ncbi:hypothetical protein P3632_22035 [Vibrio parahaemolyticus]|uniref:Uncharacterized protein n=1 Tax=Vibrio parahaemolyticus TaxID=670 RepID=A0A7Y0SI75_VIBPH|nr:hypothetical protein [Vibrio parahaemolyticus]MDF5045557.1 hypothetical protein [Vibrio parahaemolyticus]MDF5234462.1 hypothetical protein [Vibrio parahaemolyticus]MDF5243705.1 hypothetical protein [Vibrio parahaemolyticus]MDF5256981.1 hypothetical protein [Vibrio parahaemolyticus]MDF5276084.1 hypothetical protein [Vibrio parahaemolyticus]
MKLSRCPVCHANLHLEALVQDDAGRELLGEVAKLPDFVAKPMLSYLGLFRPAKQDLSNARAVKLLQEVLEKYRADHVLASALAETVSKIHEKRSGYSDSRPLANHNYLKQVYQSAATRLGGSPDGKQSGSQVNQPKDDGSAWYFEQAERMIKAGQDPLGKESSIASRLKELGWNAQNQR